MTKRGSPKPRAGDAPPRGKAGLLPPNRRPGGGREAPASRVVVKASRELSAGRRWLRRLSVFTGVVVVLSASILVAWAGRRYLWSSPRFAIREVIVQGQHRLSADQIAEASGVGIGTNAFSIDEEVASAHLSNNPWIRSGELSVELPSTLVIKVVEREARALATVGATLYLVDSNGEPFKELAEGDPHDLPVLTGIDPDEAAQDRDALKLRFGGALELLSHLEQAKMTRRYPIQEVRIEADDTLSAVVGSSGITLQLGPPPYRTKVRKAVRILEELRHRKIKRAVLFLDNRSHPERVVVRMR